VTCPELLGGALTDGVVRIMEARGFHYVPADILDARYDGVMAGNPSLPTWWIRYFTAYAELCIRRGIGRTYNGSR
jgi:hypothetical protein